MAIRDLFYLLVRDYWENVQGGKLCSLLPLTGDENRFAALIHFKDYAYERNVSGAALIYKQLAGIALSGLHTGDWSSDSAEADIWSKFKEECRRRGEKGIKPNVRVNPLRPSAAGKKSILAFVRDIACHETIAAWAFRMISEGRIAEAHSALKTVWGVGDKIASFYLRDIFWLGHGLNPEVTIEADYLLQPIDIWVERAGQALGHVGKSKESLARFISSFEKENNIAHGGANIGCWILGSNYVDDPQKFHNVLQVVANIAPEPTLALSVANRFETFFGGFGVRLRNIIVHNNRVHPIAEKVGSG